MAKTTSALGARLRALRQERGLDIGTVAYRTGLDYNYIYRLERGGSARCWRKSRGVRCTCIRRCEPRGWISSTADFSAVGVGQGGVMRVIHLPIRYILGR